MKCKDCPCTDGSFYKRLNDFDEILKSDPCEELPPRDMFIEDLEEDLWCNKVGGKIWWAGYCGDAYEDKPLTKRISRKIHRFNKHERVEKQKRYLKALYEKTFHSYPSSALPMNKFGRWADESEEVVYYMRVWRKERSSKYIKRQCNHKVRRYKGEISRGNSYRRLAEFWWEMY